MESKSYKAVRRPPPPIIDLITCKHDVIRKKITKTVWREIGDHKILLGTYTAKQCSRCGNWVHTKVETK